jgi:sulfite dehydrogenase (quinone) subunit SoeA
MKGLNGERHCPTSVPSADEIKTTTCYMCPGRCGIRVHLKDGKVRYIGVTPHKRTNRCAPSTAWLVAHRLCNDET